MNYPDRFIFNENQDTQGNIYKNAYSNKKIPCIISIAGKNILVNGKLKIFTRNGVSGFGKELGFVFHISDIEKEYSANSKQEVVEFYLPEEVGIKFLEDTLEYLKGED